MLLLSNQSIRSYWALLSIISLLVLFSLYYFSLSYCSLSSWSQKSNLVDRQNKYISVQSILPVEPILMNLSFSVDSVYHHDGVAYDYYSYNDLGQSKASYQWNFWSLPHEINQKYSVHPVETSPFVMSKIPFVDVIYVIARPNLTERHDNLKKALLRQGIPIESIEWRMKWNHKTCNSNSSRSYVYQRLNLKDKPLDTEQQHRCAVTMEHVDIWYEIAERNVRLALILEDDAIFVPFFKEKFIRTIYAAINYRILRMNRACAPAKEKSISDDEWINQNPMIVIGGCLSRYSQYFQRNIMNAPPVLSARKSSSFRCTHAYLLTSCSAQALIDQIHKETNDFKPSDYMQDHLVRFSSTLQAFWMDPPLAYQGNQVTDLDKLSSFKIQTHKLDY